MISDSQRESLKQELQQRQNLLIEQVQDHYGQTLELVKESMSELSNYDNHPADMGTELFERQKDIALNEHTEKELEDINSALHSLEAGTYGLCSACGRDIPFERLEAVPTTDRCIEHADHQPVYENRRPLEEGIYSPNINPDELTEETQVGYDAEDTWQDVARYGTSESPSDFYEPKADYDEMYPNSDEFVGEAEAIEGIAAADITGNYDGIANNFTGYADLVDIEKETD
ncbi:TraR/DksA C4-type zinc finger protein [Aciduricibacillus chroicocephali]|uniref:TraR/DksA C4-type zinc finger protein n=1 Tax=Aciduricibacillus chroicocephali TaxID=3054939 RepID=A0ABY9KW87_9BACI|nr:TraR/DksA C4-type zinc finger protein [Bacillaceae bacterium 44XB]